MQGLFLFIIAVALLPTALAVIAETFWWFIDRGTPGVVALLVLLTITFPLIGIPASAYALYLYLKKDDGQTLEDGDGVFEKR